MRELTTPSVKLIVHERYTGTRTFAELLANIILSAYNSECKNVWTLNQPGDIIKSPTEKS